MIRRLCAILDPFRAHPRYQRSNQRSDTSRKSRKIPQGRDFRA
jgi:hypothetical protein